MFLSIFYLWKNQKTTSFSYEQYKANKNKRAWLIVKNIYSRRYHKQHKLSELQVRRGTLLKSGVVYISKRGDFLLNEYGNQAEKVRISAKSAKIYLKASNFNDLWTSSSFKKIELHEKASIMTQDYSLKGKQIFFLPLSKKTWSQSFVTLMKGDSILFAKKGFSLNLKTGGGRLFGPIEGTLQNHDK